MVTPKSSIAEEAKCASEDLGSLVCFDSVTSKTTMDPFMGGISSVCVCVFGFGNKKYGGQKQV